MKLCSSCFVVRWPVWLFFFVGVVLYVLFSCSPKIEAVLFHLVFLCLYREFISVYIKHHSFVALQPYSVLSRLIVDIFRSHKDTHTHSHTPLNKWSTRRRDRYLHNTQQTQETNIHSLSGIRTCDSNNQEAADPRLRQRGHRMRLILIYPNINITFNNIFKTLMILIIFGV